jgi:hypothetical protein
MKGVEIICRHLVDKAWKAFIHTGRPLDRSAAGELIEALNQQLNRPG